MTKLIVILVCVIAVLLVLTFAFIKLSRKYKGLYKEEHKKLIGLEQEYSKLIEAYNVKKENKEKADEKINALHNGELSADDILPKRKSKK